MAALLASGPHLASRESVLGGSLRRLEPSGFWMQEVGTLTFPSSPAVAAMLSGDDAKTDVVMSILLPAPRPPEVRKVLPGTQ